MNKVLAGVIILLGVIFLVFPLASDSYSHYLQDKTYRVAQQQTVSCRAELALSMYSTKGPLPGKTLEKALNNTCGVLPEYEDFSYVQTGILSLYNWIGQKITFVPL